MTIFDHAGVPVSAVKDLSPIPPELELFARIEGLVGEEAALLAIPRQERKREQRERLRDILGRARSDLGEAPRASDAFAR